MTTWEKIFEPARAARGLGIREQQETLGNSVISAFSTGKALVAEAPTGTGKSLAVLIPLIDKIISAPAGVDMVRGVISTEQNSLLDQYVIDDLPFLSTVYKGFKFQALKGRANYFCMNHTKLNARGSAEATALEKALSTKFAALGEGERNDVERVLRRPLTDREWSLIQGSSTGCSDFKCEADDCFSARARALALAANIVVTNHDMLRVDADTRSDMGENFLGPFTYLVVDEAHTLEESLVDGWSETLSEWELNEMTTAVTAGVQAASSVTSNPGLARASSEMADNIVKFMKNATKFYGLLHKDEDWNRVSDVLQLKFVRTKDPSFLGAMKIHEEDGTQYLEDAITVLTGVEKFIKESLKADAEADGIMSRPDKRNARKGVRNASKLLKIMTRMSLAMQEKSGTVMEYGVPYSVSVEGYVRKNGEKSIRFTTTPLDISARATAIWSDRHCVLVSATLRDMTDGSFRFTKASLGLDSPTELVVGTPFDYNKNQLVYVTKGQYPLAETPGAKYSFDELVEVLNASKGRALVLFTARVELEEAADKLKHLWANGQFDHTVLVQDGIISTKELSRDFKNDESSVLLGLKSFFTGKNFEGATLSNLTMCKYTLKQYTPLCRQQIEWWRTRGFGDWYEMQSMTTFRQAAGRLIRSESDKGVITILDSRANDARSNVYKTLSKAVKSLGSPVTQTITDVEAFLT